MRIEPQKIKVNKNKVDDPIGEWSRRIAIFIVFIALFYFFIKLLVL